MSKFYFLVWLFVFPVLLFGQEEIDSLLFDEIQQIVVQENRIETPFSSTSRNIQVLSHREISQLPVSSVPELLTFVLGVDMRQRDPFGSQADISIDGSSFEQTLVLLNGVKLMDSQTAHHMMNIPIPLEAIEHIEVLRGAAARVYGVNALAGAVNIVTKKESDSFVSAEIFGGSSFESKDPEEGSGIYGGGGVQVTGNYGTSDQSHLLSFGQDLYNGHRYNTAVDNTKIFYNGNRKISHSHSIQAIGGYVHNRFGANGFYAAPGDRNSEEIVETTLFSLSSRHQWGRFVLKPRISDRYNRDDYRYFKDDLQTARSIHYTNALMMEVNASAQTKIGTFGFGWESRFETINSSNIGDHRRTHHGIYTEYRGFFRDRLISNLGAYIHYNPMSGWQIYPGVDVAYLIGETMKISANLGSGQRIPSFTDLYVDQKPGNVGNPDVEPENAWNYEVNFRYEPEGWRVQVGYLYRNIHDFIDWVREDMDHPYTPRNFGRNKIHGLYGQFHHVYQLGKGESIILNAGYNFLSPHTNELESMQSKYVLESLRHQLIAGIQYDHQKFSLRLNNRWLQRELNSAYDILDLRFLYRLRFSEMYMDVTNLLNTEYHEIAAVPLPPRWFKIGVRFHWQ